MITDNKGRSDSRLELVRTNWKNPIWWRDVALAKLVLPIMEMRNSGSYILDQSWNSMIILDACRYDVFEKSIRESTIQGSLSRWTSIATDTGEFLIRNFVGRNCYDVVYVSANPFADKIIKKSVYKLIPVWRTHWNEEEDTVLPESMYECTIKAAKEYPNKRIISHFIQPHYPYIGHKKLNVSKFESAKPEEEQIKGGGYTDTSFFTTSAKLIYAKAMQDKYDHLEAYTDNLQQALPYVERLVNLLPGRTVITADHGEAFGEKISRFVPIKVYGHMPGMRIRALTEVPWFVIEPEQKLKQSSYISESSRSLSDGSPVKEHFSPA
jgi:hypothetical protein